MPSQIREMARGMDKVCVGNKGEEVQNARSGISEHCPQYTEERQECYAYVSLWSQTFNMCGKNTEPILFT